MLGLQRWKTPALMASTGAEYTAFEQCVQEKIHAVDVAKNCGLLAPDIRMYGTFLRSRSDSQTPTFQCDTKILAVRKDKRASASEGRNRSWGEGRNWILFKIGLSFFSPSLRCQHLCFPHLKGWQGSQIEPHGCQNWLAVQFNNLSKCQCSLPAEAWTSHPPFEQQPDQYTSICKHNSVQSATDSSGAAQVLWNSTRGFFLFKKCTVFLFMHSLISLLSRFASIK